MRYIFLDFDGVLVPLESPSKKARPAEAEPRCMAQLNRIVAETDAKIVLTTSWSLFNSAEALGRVLNRWGFLGDVIGAVPKEPYTRGAKVLAWLAANPGVESFVAIDDEELDMEEVAHNLVVTNPMFGLGKVTATMAIDLLLRNHS